jgi:hypothetical protein
MIIKACDRCGGVVNDELLHEQWHQTTEASAALYEAHVENLIERMHVLEEAIDGGPEDVYYGTEATRGA